MYVKVIYGNRCSDSKTKGHSEDPTNGGKIKWLDIESLVEKHQ
jgi:hypothetical protein